MAVVGDDVEIVVALAQAGHDAGDRADAGVDGAESPEGGRVLGTEGVGVDVVVHEVHVERGHAAVEVEGDAEREQLPQPAADHEAGQRFLRRENPMAEGEGAERGAEPAHDLTGREDARLHGHPREDEERNQPAPDAEGPRVRLPPEQAGEGQDGVGSAAPEDAAVGPAPVDDAPSPLGVGGLDSRRRPRPGEPEVLPRPLVHELEPRDVDRTAASSRRAWESPQIWTTMKRRRRPMAARGMRAHRAKAVGSAATERLSRDHHPPIASHLSGSPARATTRRTTGWGRTLARMRAPLLLSQHHG